MGLLYQSYPTSQSEHIRNEMSLKEKVAIITGSSSGIGAAIAEKFAAEGARVVIIGRNQNKLDAVAQRVENAGSAPLVLRVDVTDENDSRKIIKDTLQHFRRIDILINNAGTVINSGIQEESVMNIFDKVMNLNLRSVVFLSHLAVPHLIETKGNIINMSSAASTLVYHQFVYFVSKAALDHFSRCVALELAPKGVRVNTINPGPVATDIIENTGANKEDQEKTWQLWKNATALNRIADAEEIADLAVFLASDKARSITGSSYLTDNGVLLK